jgi:hypothetical protein
MSPRSPSTPGIRCARTTGSTSVFQSGDEAPQSKAKRRQVAASQRKRRQGAAVQSKAATRRRKPNKAATRRRKPKKSGDKAPQSKAKQRQGAAIQSNYDGSKGDGLRVDLRRAGCAGLLVSLRQWRARGEPPAIPTAPPFTPWPTPPAATAFDFPLLPAHAYGPYIPGTSGPLAVDTRYGAQNPALGDRDNCFRDAAGHPVPFSQLYHAGLDLFALDAGGQVVWGWAAHQPVHAVADGVVVFTLETAADGVIIVEHFLPDGPPSIPSTGTWRTRRCSRVSRWHAVRCSPSCSTRGPTATCTGRCGPFGMAPTCFRRTARARPATATRPASPTPGMTIRPALTPTLRLPRPGGVCGKQAGREPSECRIGAWRLILSQGWC